jgi:iron complex outermembrane recepter protein
MFSPKVTGHIWRTTFYLVMLLNSSPVIQAKTEDRQENTTSENPTETPSEDAVLQGMTVTGYIVPRIGEGPADVEHISQQLMNDFGTQSVEDTLSRIPNTRVSTLADSYGSGSNVAGTAQIGLNGFTGGETLVLLDGLRLPYSAQLSGGNGTFVDISSIPSKSLDSIELLFDGASARYGSDAVAGVVNFKLRSDFEGGDVGFAYNVNRNGTGQRYHTWAVGGFTDHLNDQSKVNIMVSFDYNEIDSVYARDFAWMQPGDLTRYGYNNQLSPSPGLGIFYNPDNKLFRVKRGSDGTKGIEGIDRYQGADEVYNRNWIYQDKPRDRIINVMGHVSYDLNPYINFHGTYLFSEVEDKILSAMSSPRVNDHFMIPANNPYNPYGDRFSGGPGQGTAIRFGQIDYWTPDGLYNPSTVRNQTYWTNAGIRIQNLPNNWFVTADFVYSEVQSHRDFGNHFSRSRYQLALNGELPGFKGQFLNPFVDYFTYGDPNPALTRATMVNPVWDARSQLDELSVEAGGELLNMPAGPVTLGVGFQYVDTKMFQTRDWNSIQGDVLGFGKSGLVTASRNVASGYFQVSIPLLGNQWSFPGGRDLEVLAGQRYDQYNDFGSTAKPGFSVIYKPIDDLAIRASYQESYVAPTLFQMYAPENFQSYTIYDSSLPKDDPYYNQPRRVAERQLSNPDLKPATAYGFSIGAVWTPGAKDPEHSPVGFLNGLTASIALTNIKYRGSQSELDPQYMIDEVAKGNHAYERYIHRDQDHHIYQIDTPFVNIGSQTIQNLMFSVDYSIKEYSWGKIDLSYSASYNISNHIQIVRDGPIYDYQNTSPSFQFYINAFYSKQLFHFDDFRAGLTMTYYNGYKGPNFSPSLPNEPYTSKIPSWYVFDWQISYEFGKPDKVTPETPAPGYTKEGKRILGDNNQVGKAAGTSFWRSFLGGTTITLGIYNVFDQQLPMMDNDKYDRIGTVPWGYGRSFLVSVEKKW